MASEPDRSDSDDESPTSIVSNRSGGIDIAAKRVNIDGDVVGHDKITTIGYTIEQVSTLLTQISSTFQPKPFDGRCPYLGLDAFSEDDADRFFGRETLIAELIERVKSARFLVIAGPSGSGKSSLVRAGLLHQLKQSALPNSDRWLYATLTPGRDPIESLALAVSRLKSPDLGDYLRQHATDPNALHKCAESALSDLKDQRVLIFVDQFEEVFTQISKESDRVAFLNLLITAATIDNGRVTVLFALRSDFVANCATYPQLNTLLNQQFLQVGAMQPDELVSAIARPALEVGLRIDPDLVKQIVDDMGDEPGALPLMQFALKDLFDAEQAKGGIIALTLNDYLARGGLRKALERHADAAFAQLSATEQQLARSIFAGLIEIGSGRADTRRTASFTELVPASAASDPVHAVIQKLADARLITTDEHNHQESVMISHERLIDAWPWLRKLIDENRESIALQNDIASDAQEWNDYQRDASYLYTGARLATAREELTARKIVLNELAQAFVEAGIVAVEEASRREDARRQKELDDARKLAEAEAARASEARARVLEVEAERDRAERQTRLARSRELAAIALSQINVDPERSLLIAIEATRSGSTFEAQDALRKLLLMSLVRLELPKHEHWVNSAQFSPDSQLIVTASSDQTAQVWEAATGRALTVLRGHKGSIIDAQFAPDSQQITTASWDQTARVWDVATGREQTVLHGHAGKVTSVQFSPDGHLIVTASSDQTARVWDAATGEERVVLRGHEHWINRAQFSSDGHLIVTASWDKTARVWDVATGREQQVLRGHEGKVTHAQFSPDGRLIITASWDQTARMWETATGEECAVLRSHEGKVTHAQFSPDGHLIATASSDQTVRIWDVATGREQSILRGHEGMVTHAQFSPDGQLIVTASSDQTARVWEAATSEERAVLRGHTGSIRTAQFSASSQQIVTVGWDGTARVYPVHLADLIALAKIQVTRELTKEERLKYLREEVDSPSQR